MPSHNGRRAVPDEKLQKMLAAMRCGESVRSVALRFGCHYNTAWRHARRAGLQLGGRPHPDRHFEPVEDRAIAAAHAVGVTVKDLADAWSCNATTIRNAIDRASQGRRPARA